MWIVAKIKIREKNIFEQDLRKKLGSKIIFYNPNIEVKQFIKNKFRIVKKSILENYIFCYHDNFKNIKILDNLKFTRGLSFFLKESNLNQRKIIEFINYCKSFENEKGFITSGFFKKIVTNKGRFLSGPFSNLIFEIIEKQKNKMKIMIDGIMTIVPDTKNYIYKSV